MTVDIHSYGLRIMAAHAVAAQKQAERAVIGSVVDGLITRTEAASILGTSRAQVNRLVKRYEEAETTG
jgi:DNA-directed RNA polymerase specialized sigma subunit